jgi:hypothetical protein
MIERAIAWLTLLWINVLGGTVDTTTPEGNEPERNRRERRKAAALARRRYGYDDDGHVVDGRVATRHIGKLSKRAVSLRKQRAAYEARQQR